MATAAPLNGQHHRTKPAPPDLAVIVGVGSLMKDLRYEPQILPRHVPCAAYFGIFIHLTALDYNGTDAYHLRKSDSSITKDIHLMGASI